jgi:hypothetical protein
MWARGRDHRAMRFALAAVLSLLLAPVAACDGGESPSPDAAGTRAPSRALAAPERTVTPTPTPTPTPFPAGPPSTREALMRRLDGRRIPVDGRVVRIDRATLVCGGLGRATDRRSGRPAWVRFRCVQPTFPPGAVAGPDAILVVAPARRHRLVVVESRLTGY